MGKRRMFLFVLGAIIVIGIVLFWVNPAWRNAFISLFQLETLAEIRDFVRSLGFWGPVILILLMVLHSVVFVPAEILTLADIAIYGPFWGVVYSWIGSMLGAYLSFFLAKLVGRPIASRFVSKRMLLKFDGFIQRYGVKGLFVLRLIPVVSFNALNYAAGFTNITLWQFTWTTGLGILPAGILLAVLYQSVAGIKYAFIGLTVAGILLLAIMLLKAKLEKKMNKTEKN